MFMPAIQAPFGLVEFNVNDLKDLRFDDDDKAATAVSPFSCSRLISTMMKHLRM